jgi:hypothetical protein
LPRGSHPSGSGDDSFEQVGVVRLGLALPQREDVGGREYEGQRSYSDAKRGRVMADEQERKADAQEESRDDKHNGSVPRFPKCCRRCRLQRSSGQSACSWRNRDGGHAARVKEGFGNEHGQPEKKAADDGHLAHVGVAAAHLPAAMRNDNDHDDEEKLCNDTETFGHRAVERSLSENEVHGSRCSWFSEPSGPESGAT